MNIPSKNKAIDLLHLYVTFDHVIICRMFQKGELVVRFYYPIYQPQIF